MRRESQGRLNVQVFPNTQLGSDASMILQLRSGALQMSLQGVGPLSAISPVIAIGVVGFIFNDAKQALAAMDGALGGVIRGEVEKRGITAFETAWANGFRQIHTGNRAIRGPEDLAGMKLRVIGGQTTADLFKTLGASPVGMDISEVYTALQTHLLDGADDTNFNTYTFRFYEVQKYLSLTNHQWSSYWMLCNGDAFKSLPSDLQAIVRRNANAAGKREARAALLQDAAVQDLLVRGGMILNRTNVTAFRSKLTGYYQRWKQEFGPTAWAAGEQYAGKLG